MTGELGVTRLYTPSFYNWKYSEVGGVAFLEFVKYTWLQTDFKSSTIKI